MKTYFILTAVLYLIMMLSAVIPLTVSETESDEKSVQAVATVYDSANETKETEAEVESVKVFRHSDNSVSTVELHDYIYGAVAAEMPVSFHDEAIKAQAVACYTFTLWIKNNADNPSEELSDVSDDPKKHQGYLDKQQMKDLWGDDFDRNYNRIKKLVDSVYGEYISYNNEPIMAVFHSLSPGCTADVSDVWKSSLPYLKSTSAPGDKLSPDYISTVSITTKEFSEKVKSCKDYNFDFSTPLLGKTEKTESGYIKTAEIYSSTMYAAQLRSLFNLKSPFFTFEINKTTVTFTVYGHGHGVGMSQYSADYMARQSSDYKQILSHFYNGTQIIKEE